MYSIPSEFDIIVRMRYDSIVGDHAWEKWIELAADQNVVCGFGNYRADQDYTHGLEKFEPNLIEAIPRTHESKRQRPRPLFDDQLLDFMIIHPRSRLQNAHNLHAVGKLYPANIGWFQVLAPGGSVQNFNGGVHLTRLTK